MSAAFQVSARNDRHTRSEDARQAFPAWSPSAIDVEMRVERGGPPPHLAVCHSDAAEARRAGFTLLEVLVSIVILTLLVIACASLYEQTANAWQSGLERTESTLIGRTLCGFIARELEQAVPEDAEAGFDFSLTAGGASTITFVKLVDATADESAARRAAIRVSYSWAASGTELGVVRRTMQTSADEVYDVTWGASDTADIGAYIDNVEFLPPDGWTTADGLPRYVDVYLDVVSPEDYEKSVLSGGAYDLSTRVQTYQMRAQMRNRGRSSW